VYQI